MGMESGECTPWKSWEWKWECTHFVPRSESGAALKKYGSDQYSGLDGCVASKIVYPCSNSYYIYVQLKINFEFVCPQCDHSVPKSHTWNYPGLFFFVEIWVIIAVVWEKEQFKWIFVSFFQDFHYFLMNSIKAKQRKLKID